MRLPRKLHFCKNWAISRLLISSELLFNKRVLTVEMTEWWCNLFSSFFVGNFRRNVNGIAHQNCHYYRIKQINNNFLWCELLSTKQMTPKCSKHSTHQNVQNIQWNCASKLSLLSYKTNQQQFSLVWTLINQTNDTKMFKTLQWNHSPFLLSLNILTSFLKSIRVLTMGRWCRFVIDG